MDYQMLGIPVGTLVEAVFNGVIYGIIEWIIYSLATRTQKPKSKKQPAQPAK
jgi:hypothetical protein